MIYDFPAASEPIRQGDIFSSLPRLDYSLLELPLVGEHEGEDKVQSWVEATGHSREPVTFAVTARPVHAIVITQDCDAIRANKIALCEIRPLEDVVKGIGANVKKFVNDIRHQSAKKLTWFYLPADAKLGFDGKMAVDFEVTLSVPRVDLKHYSSLRMGRLNVEADEHFRERLAQYFRRYPVDEWYPFTKEEFEQYRSDYPEAEPRLYQEDV